MAGWHHRLNGHESEQAPGDDDGQGSLMRCSPWGRRESDTTKRLNNFLFVERTQFTSLGLPSLASFSDQQTGGIR